MPRAPVGGKDQPFSIDMKPTTCVTALRRTIIIRKPQQDDGQCERQLLALGWLAVPRDLEDQRLTRR